MEINPFAAGLLAALFWGISPIFSKRGLSYGGSPLLVTIVVVMTGLGLFWGTMVVNNGIHGAAPNLSWVGYAIFFAGGIIGTSLGRIANYTGVDRIGASINNAVISSNPLFATILALLFLNELITPLQSLGVVIVVGGLAMLTISKGGDLSGWDHRDFVIPLLGAVAYGMGNVIRRYGLTTTPASAIEGVALNETAAFVGLGLYIVVSRAKIFERVPLKAYVYFVVTGLFSSIGVFMVFAGLKSGPVAIVATLSGTSSLITTLFSYLLLGDLERVTRGVVIGAALVVLGVILITVT